MWNEKLKLELDDKELMFVGLVLAIMSLRAGSDLFGVPPNCAL